MRTSQLSIVASFAGFFFLIASCLGQAQLSWSDVSSGLPPGFVINNIVSRANDAIAAVKSPAGVHIFSPVSNTWSQYAPAVNKYGIGNLVVGSDNRLYCIHQGGLHVLNETASPRAWIRLAPGLRNAVTLAAGVSSKLYIHANGTTNPVILEYDAITGTTRDLQFPARALDGKPHVQLLSDPSGNVWYSSNYAGTFLYSAASQSWAQVERSGQLSIAADGSTIISYEVTPTTQINSMFKFNPDTQTWKLFMTDKGYGCSGPAVGASGVLMLGGRFPDFITSATDGKKWTLPSTQADVDLSVVDQKGIRIAGEAVLPDGTILAAQELPPLSGTAGVRYTRILKLQVPNYPNLDALPFSKTDLTLQLGTYLSNGGVGNSAVGVAYVGERLVAGLNSNQGDATGPGQLMLLSSDASAIVSNHRLPGRLLGLAAAGSGSNRVAFVTNTTIGMMDMVSGAMAWQLPDSSASKSVDVSTDGLTVVVQCYKVVRVLSAVDGSVLQSVALSRDYVTDVAVSSTHRLFYITGFDNKRLPSGSPVQVAWLVAHSITDGSFQWQRFGFNGADLSTNIADTRLYKVKLGGDGQHLDIMGESAGSQTIFRYDGVSWTGPVMLTYIDFHNDLWNTASAHITYTARVDAATGDIQLSQLTMPRLPDGKSNTFRNGDIASDAAGRLFFGGACTFQMAQRDALTVNGQPVGPYKAADPAFVALSPDLKARYTWTTFNRAAGSGTVTGVATSNGKVALLATIDAGGQAFTTPGALQATSSAASEASVYLAVVDVAANYPALS